MSGRSALLASVLALALAAPSPPGAKAAKAPAKAPLLAIEEVAVAPAAPGPDTLCKLRVTLRNRGTAPASRLRFAVGIGGREVEAYRDKLWLQALPPGAATEVALYNFWTTETGRPAPKDGKLAVEVTLAEARWMKGEDDGKGAVVWTPAGEVEGLPLARSMTLRVKAAR